MVADADGPALRPQRDERSAGNLVRRETYL